MWDKAKYVVGTVINPHPFTNVRAAIVFPEHLGHTLVRNLFVAGSITGAGFFHLDLDGRVQVYDRSSTLGVDSKPEDAELVAKAIGVYDETKYEKTV